MIDPVSSGRIGPVALRSAQRATAPVARSSAQVPDAAIIISDMAALPHSLVADGPPIDTARVKALRDAINSGDYPVNPVQIAAAMLADERQRGGAA